MTHISTDIAIIGGGVVGGALALGLAQLGLKVSVIEKVKPPEFDPLKKPDLRVLAINFSSVNFLHNLGVWENVLAMRSHPYRKLDTWVWDNSAQISFDSSELKLPLLGYMIENNVLQLALWQEIKTKPEINLFVPASINKLYNNIDNKNFIVLDNGDTLSANIVIGADGANSQVRRMTGINIHAWQYQQSCMLITVKCEDKPGESTWQCFTPKGPHAFLPLFKNWASLVWYDTPTRIRQLQKMSMMQLKYEVDNHFPSRLGNIKPVATGVFPLIRVHSLQYVRNKVALVGDAAHTIHPLAGQGVNLGYRDIIVLLKLLANNHFFNEKWSIEKVLRNYQTQRMVDNFIMQLGMDLFYLGFSSNLLPVRILRKIGLITVSHISILKRQILKYALGL